MVVVQGSLVHFYFTHAGPEPSAFLENELSTCTSTEILLNYDSGYTEVLRIFKVAMAAFGRLSVSEASNAVAKSDLQARPSPFKVLCYEPTTVWPISRLGQGFTRSPYLNANLVINSDLIVRFSGDELHR